MITYITLLKLLIALLTKLICKAESKRKKPLAFLDGRVAGAKSATRPKFYYNTPQAFCQVKNAEKLHKDHSQNLYKLPIAKSVESDII